MHQPRCIIHARNTKQNNADTVLVHKGNIDIEKALQGLPI